MATTTRTTRTTTKKITPKRSTGVATLDLQLRIPDEKFAQEYVQRTVAGGKTDFETYDLAREMGINVLLEGPTGAGKTTSGLAYAAARRLPFYSVSSTNGVDPERLFGKYQVLPDKTVVWLDGGITHICRYGGVLLINEINFLPAGVQTRLFSLLDGRREITLEEHNDEVIKAHPDVLIIADMNPGYRGTRELNEALRNRFDIPLTWGYDPEVERILIPNNPLRELMVGLREQGVQGQIETPVATNMGIVFLKLLKRANYEFASAAFVNHFAEDERETVARVLEANRTAIEEEMLTDAEKEMRLEERRMTAKYGYNDPEYGVYGVDWAWKDDPNYASYGIVGDEEEGE